MEESVILVQGAELVPCLKGRRSPAAGVTHALMIASSTRSCVAGPAKHEPQVNSDDQKYSTLPKFGIAYISPHSGPRKRGVSRSSRTRAGRRWTLVTSARRDSQGGQP